MLTTSDTLVLIPSLKGDTTRWASPRRPADGTANGNLTARGRDTFTWDSANRLTGATVSGTTATMGYDGSHQMVAKTVGAAMTRYVYDRNLAQAEMLTEGSTTYLYGRGMQNGFGPELQETGGTRT